LPFTAFNEVSAAVEIRPSDLAALLTIPPRTIARRKKEGRLRPEESDKLLRLGRIVVLAEESLGTSQKASAWLKKGNRALGGDSPLAYLDTDVGAREVEGLLIRISHGVYS
jgi:putative toxin-antitoxin system antitoxin component (TIGR02293 family)